MDSLSLYLSNVLHSPGDLNQSCWQRHHIPVKCCCLSTKICSVTSHYTMHIYQTTQCHIPHHCTHLPNYVVSHPITLYTSTKLCSVTSHNTVHIYQTTQCHIPTTANVMLSTMQTSNLIFFPTLDHHMLCVFVPEDLWLIKKVLYISVK